MTWPAIELQKVFMSSIEMRSYVKRRRVRLILSYLENAVSSPQQSVEHLQRLFEKFVPKVLDFRSHHCKELIPTSELNSVISLCALFDALATEENGVRFCRRLSLFFSFFFFFCFSKMLFINIFVITLTGKSCEANLQHLHKITRCVDI